MEIHGPLFSPASKQKPSLIPFIMNKSNLSSLILIGLFLFYSGCRSVKPERIRNFPPVEIPEFPIPYPTPSASYIPPLEIYPKCKTLGEVAELINKSLDFLDYPHASYFQVPGGMALVTQMEAIEEDGSSILGRRRWEIQHHHREVFSLSDYLIALFTAKPGYFRSMVFLVNKEAVYASESPAEKDVVENWSWRGANRLPLQLAENPIDQDYTLTILIYEFKVLENSTGVLQELPSRLTGKEHLSKSKVLETISLSLR